MACEPPSVIWACSPWAGKPLEAMTFRKAARVSSRPTVGVYFTTPSRKGLSGAPRAVKRRIMAGCIGRLTLPMATLTASTASPRFMNSIWARRMPEGSRCWKCSESIGFMPDLCRSK